MAYWYLRYSSRLSHLGCCQTPAAQPDVVNMLNYMSQFGRCSTLGARDKSSLGHLQMVFRIVIYSGTATLAVYVSAEARQCPVCVN